MSTNVSIIGDGGWGTALAMMLAGNGHKVTVWGPFADYIEKIKESGKNETFLPGIDLPRDINWTADHKEAAADAEVVVLAIPSKYFRAVVESFSELIPAACHVVSVAKGLDKSSHKRMTEVAKEILKPASVSALSGPSHAEEVARGIPTAVTLASADTGHGSFLQDIFTTSRFRVYTSSDVAGVEYGGAFKNVIAIAVGVSDGIGFGDNTRAALVTRGLAEIARLGCALGAQPETFAGLSGAGDLIVTCTSGLSRNRSAGERLGKGESIDQVLATTKQAVEGAWNCASARELARNVNVEVPITEQVYAIVHEGKNPHDAVEDLLSRDVGKELRAMEN